MRWIRGLGLNLGKDKIFGGLWSTTAWCWHLLTYINRAKQEPYSSLIECTALLKIHHKSNFSFQPWALQYSSNNLMSSIFLSFFFIRLDCMKSLTRNLLIPVEYYDNIIKSDQKFRRDFSCYIEFKTYIRVQKAQVQEMFLTIKT